MPVYEFECLSCKHIFEDIVVFKNRDALVLCPKCVQLTAHRTTRIYPPSVKIDGSELTKIVKNPNDGADGF